MKWLLCLMAAPLLAQSPDYYPLAVGNSWIYRASGTRAGQSLTVQVTSSQQFGIQTYFLLSQNPGGDTWVREDASGKVFAYDPASGQESLWYDFGAPEGQVYQTSLPVCCGRAEVRSRQAQYNGYVGKFTNALEIGYPGAVQVGTSSELFLPSIGMVYRLVGTGGPTTAGYDLNYAKLGGVVTIAAPEVATAISLDSPIYGPTDLITLRLTVRNTTSMPIHLTFPTAQMYDLAIRNENGDVVWRWSDGRVFADVIVDRDFSGETNFSESIDLSQIADGGLAPGKYTLEGFLTPTTQSRYSATAGFEVQQDPSAQSRRERNR